MNVRTVLSLGTEEPDDVFDGSYGVGHLRNTLQQRVARAIARTNKTNTNDKTPACAGVAVGQLRSRPSC